MTVSAIIRPPIRLPAIQTHGMVATLITPESDRAPRFDEPKTFIQKCSRK